MTFTLCLSALLKFLLGVVLVAALLFIPAGTLNYPNAILLMVILFVPMFLARLVLMVKNPDLLRRRLKVKEEPGGAKKNYCGYGFYVCSGLYLSRIGFSIRLAATTTNYFQSFCSSFSSSLCALGRSFTRKYLLISYRYGRRRTESH